MSRFLLFLRSLVFALLMIVATVIWAPLCFLSAPLSYNRRYYWTSRWNVFVIWAAKVICGIRYEIKGFENLPDTPAILLSKHQSAWETIFYLYFMPRPLVYVFKKEIMYIPFFGWGMALLRMIPIDRSKGRDAFSQIIEQGKKRLAGGTAEIADHATTVRNSTLRVERRQYERSADDGRSAADRRPAPEPPGPDEP